MAEKKNKKSNEKKKSLFEREFSQTQDQENEASRTCGIKKMEIEELIHVEREKLQLKRMTKELVITMMDTTNLDPKQ